MNTNTESSLATCQLTQLSVTNATCN